MAGIEGFQPLLVSMLLHVDTSQSVAATLVALARAQQLHTAEAARQSTTHHLPAATGLARSQQQRVAPSNGLQLQWHVQSRVAGNVAPHLPDLSCAELSSERHSQPCGHYTTCLLLQLAAAGPPAPACLRLQSIGTLLCFRAACTRGACKTPAQFLPPQNHNLRLSHSQPRRSHRKMQQGAKQEKADGWHTLRPAVASGALLHSRFPSP